MRPGLKREGTITNIRKGRGARQVHKWTTRNGALGAPSPARPLLGLPGPCVVTVVAGLLVSEATVDLGSTRGVTSENATELLFFWF